MRWARHAPEALPPAIPSGFSARVTARWGKVPSINNFALWQKAIWGSAWAAAVVILLGIVLLTAQRLRTNSVYGFSPAYQVVSMELVP
jgi:hypothetical protein